MADMEITIRLPEELVERAQAAGIDIESLTADVAELLERKQAGRDFADTPDVELMAMANDPEIQREIRQIEPEFSGAETDGLS